MHLLSFTRSLHAAIMVLIKCVAQAKKAAKEVNLGDDVLDMSITIGLQGADIDKVDIAKLD